MPLDAARWQIDILAADRTGAAFASADSRMRAFQRASASAGNAMGAVWEKVGASIAAALSVRALVQWGERLQREADTLADTAENLKLAVDELDALRGAALLAGQSVEGTTNGLERFNAFLGQAAEGGKEQIERLNELGVYMLDAAGKERSRAAVLEDLSRKLVAMGDSSKRTAGEVAIFGRSGQSLSAMLTQWAKGTQELNRELEAQGLKLTPEVNRQLAEMADKSDVAAKKIDVLFAPFYAIAKAGAMEAVAIGLERINNGFERMKGFAGLLDKLGAFMGGTFNTSPTGSNLRSFADEYDRLGTKIEETKNKLQDLDKRQAQSNFPQADYYRSTREKLAAQLLELDLQRQQVERAMSHPGGTTVTVRPPGGGGRNPAIVDKGAAQKLTERLQELQDEHKALDAALAAYDAFDVQNTSQTLDEFDKRLNAQVALSKRIFDLLKGVPPNSPLAQQLIQEATAIDQVKQKLDEKKRLLGEAQKTIEQFGDGSIAAARALDQLNQMLRIGAIDQATYERAVKATKESQEDQERAARGAAGGFDAFVAGLEQGMADMNRASSAFEMGKGVLTEVNNVIDGLAGTSSRSFAQVAQDFGLMLLKMEARAAVSNLWNTLTGKGPTDQGLLGALLGSILGPRGGAGTSTYGAYAPVAASLTYGGPKASGGSVSPGSWYMVGEHGPEPFVPRSAGTILPNRALGGGNVQVIVNNNAAATQARTRERMTSNGREIEVIVEAIDAKLANRMSRGTGALNRAIDAKLGGPRRA